jgi:hemerythrin superfamily protein
MADTKILTRKPTDLLRQDHEKVMELFERYEALGDRAHAHKSDLFEKIREALTAHAAIEEEIFYPEVASLGIEEARERVREAREEHAIVKQLLNEISALAPDEEEFDVKMGVLCENVEGHVEEEEKEVFPLVKKLSKEEQNALAVRMANRKRELEAE